MSIKWMLLCQLYYNFKYKYCCIDNINRFQFFMYKSLQLCHYNMKHNTIV